MVLVVSAIFYTILIWIIITILIKGHALGRACLQTATNTQNSKPRPPETAKTDQHLLLAVVGGVVTTILMECVQSLHVACMQSACGTHAPVHMACMQSARGTHAPVHVACMRSAHSMHTTLHMACMRSARGTHAPVHMACMQTAHSTHTSLHMACMRTARGIPSLEAKLSPTA